MPRDETLVREKTVIRVDNMDVHVENEYFSTKKETQNRLNLHEFDLIFSMSQLISSGVDSGVS